MTTSMVRDLLRQRPFRPFRVVMSSGEAYEVRHPEMAWVTKNDLFIGIDHQSVIDADLTELVLDDGDPLAVLLGQDVVEQGGLPRPEESGDDGDRHSAVHVVPFVVVRRDRRAILVVNMRIIIIS
jgi:hypothetical protein